MKRMCIVELSAAMNRFTYTLRTNLQSISAGPLLVVVPILFQSISVQMGVSLLRQFLCNVCSGALGLAFLSSLVILSPTSPETPNMEKQADGIHGKCWHF